MIKLGLTQRVEVVGGERRDCLDQAWAAWLLPRGYLPVPLPNRAGGAGGAGGAVDTAALVAELGLAGVILTGGNDLAALPGARGAAPERDRFEGRLLGVCGERGLPVLGVCRGLQRLVQHAGGGLAPVKDHAGTRHGLRARPARGIPLTDRDEVNSFHRFGAAEGALGAELEPVGFAPDGGVEAVVHRRLPQWAIMWHPEREPRDARDDALLRALFGSGPGGRG